MNHKVLKVGEIWILELLHTHTSKKVNKWNFCC